MRNIPTDSAVRCNTTNRLGRVFRNPHGNPRGHIFVQWDGDRDRKVVSIGCVTYVAARYDTAKAWERQKV